MDEPLRRHLGEIAGLQPSVVPRQGVVEMKRQRYGTRRLEAGDEDEPELTFEMWLHDSFDLKVCLIDAEGKTVATFAYALASRPEGSALDLYREAWDRRREETAEAS